MFKYLETFKVVYEEGKFTIAAEKLYISQPTVSMHIKALEDEMQTTLFTRQGRQKVVPTESANVLYQEVQRLLGSWETTTQKMKQLTGQVRQNFKIGASHTFLMAVLPELLPALYRQFPLVDFEIYMANSEETLKECQQHHLDMGFIEKPLVTPEDFKRVPVLRDELVLAGNLDGELWLIREPGSGVYHYTQKYFENENVEPKLCQMIGNNELIVHLLRMNIGKSLISKRVLTPEIHWEALSEDYHRWFYLIANELPKNVVQAQITDWFVENISLLEK